MHAPLDTYYATSQPENATRNSHPACHTASHRRFGRAAAALTCSSSSAACASCARRTRTRCSHRGRTSRLRSATQVTSAQDLATSAQDLATSAQDVVSLSMGNSFQQAPLCDTACRTRPPATLCALVVSVLAALSARGYRDGAMRYKMISPTYVPVEGDFWQARHGTRPCRMDGTPVQHGRPCRVGYHSVWGTVPCGIPC